jgi:hypothetical protein
MMQTLDVRWLDEYSSTYDVLRSMTVSKDALILDEVVAEFENFLRGVGYVFDSLEVHYAKRD